jgi:hypothetical protein
MAKNETETKQRPASAPVKDRHPKDAEGAEKPSRAGASGADETAARKDLGSGLSGDKGVAAVGNPAMPTGESSGVKVGSPDKHGVMDEREDHTLAGQLREKGLASTEDEESGE